MPGLEHITDEADRDRCQAVTGAKGQCHHKCVPGYSFCQMHSGGSGKNGQEETKERVRNYNLTKYRARVNQFADNDEIKSLREEIGILRLMVEEILNRCKDTDDLLIWSHKLQDLIMKVQKLVIECHRLEERTGRLIDKPTVIVLCDSLVKIISQHIEDSDALDDIARQFLENVSKIGGLTDVLSDARVNAGTH